MEGLCIASPDSPVSAHTRGILFSHFCSKSPFYVWTRGLVNNLYSSISDMVSTCSVSPFRSVTVIPIWLKWMWAPILVSKCLPNNGYRYSGMTIKEWVTWPFSLSTDLWVVREYWLILVVPFVQDSFWDIWPKGCFRMECCALVYTIKIYEFALHH